MQPLKTNKKFRAGLYPLCFALHVLFRTACSVVTASERYAYSRRGTENRRCFEFQLFLRYENLKKVPYKKIENTVRVVPPVACMRVKEAL